MTNLKQFIRDESGAVTIDWVALTAGILLLGIAVIYAIFENGVQSVVDTINTELSSAVAADINSDFDPTGTGTLGTGTTTTTGG